MKLLSIILIILSGCSSIPHSNDCKPKPILNCDPYGHPYRCEIEYEYVCPTSKGIHKD